jgi:hypothetical protein
MNWATLLPYCIFALVVTVCGVVYQATKTYMAIKQAAAFSGGQGYVAQANAESAERVARANAYFEQVLSLEKAWQAFLENHLTLNHDKHFDPQDLRSLRAAFENMYDFSNQVNL